MFGDAGGGRTDVFHIPLIHQIAGGGNNSDRVHSIHVPDMRWAAGARLRVRVFRECADTCARFSDTASVAFDRGRMEWAAADATGFAVSRSVTAAAPGVAIRADAPVTLRVPARQLAVVARCGSLAYGGNVLIKVHAAEFPLAVVFPLDALAQSRLNFFIAPRAADDG